MLIKNLRDWKYIFDAKKKILTIFDKKLKKSVNQDKVRRLSLERFSIRCSDHQRIEEKKELRKKAARLKAGNRDKVLRLKAKHKKQVETLKEKITALKIENAKA